MKGPSVYHECATIERAILTPAGGWEACAPEPLCVAGSGAPNSPGLDEEQVCELERKLRDGGGSLAVYNASPNVYEVFETAHLNQVFEVRPAPAPPGS